MVDTELAAAYAEDLPTKAERDAFWTLVHAGYAPLDASIFVKQPWPTGWYDHFHPAVEILGGKSSIEALMDRIDTERRHRIPA